MEKGLTNNQLKLIGLLSMTCDHVGKGLLPQYPVLQIIGRLAFPIFAFMIAEGCLYTKDKKKYMVSMISMAALCQIVYFVAMGSLYQCVLVTFSLSILLIFLTKKAMDTKGILSKVILVVFYLGTFFICVLLPHMLPQTDFQIDYGMLGVLLPIVVYLSPNRICRIIFTTAILGLLGSVLQGFQWYALLAVPLLAVYNGNRGKLNLKKLFYIYYPVHLAAIYFLGTIDFNL